MVLIQAEFAIRYCCDAYLFYQVKREDLQGKQILSSNEKYYIADHSIREAVFSGNLRDINLILENIVYLELLHRDYYVTVGRTGDKEIDFVCHKQGEKLYVQVSYLLASEETVQREFGAYDAIRDNYPKYVVSLDEFDMSRNGIKDRNIRDLLLPEEWSKKMSLSQRLYRDRDFCLILGRISGNIVACAPRCE